MSLGPWETALIFLFIIILLGEGKLPEPAQGLGLRLKGFKQAMRAAKNATEIVND